MIESQFQLLFHDGRYDPAETHRLVTAWLAAKENGEKIVDFAARNGLYAEEVRLAVIRDKRRRRREAAPAPVAAISKPLRKGTYDPEADHRLFVSWKRSKKRGDRIENFAARNGLSPVDIRLAINRHEKRIEKERALRRPTMTPDQVFAAAWYRARIAGANLEEFAREHGKTIEEAKDIVYPLAKRKQKIKPKPISKRLADAWYKARYSGQLLEDFEKTLTLREKQALRDELNAIRVAAKERKAEEQKIGATAGQAHDG